MHPLSVSTVSESCLFGLIVLLSVISVANLKNTRWQREAKSPTHLSNLTLQLVLVQPDTVL